MMSPNKKRNIIKWYSDLIMKKTQNVNKWIQWHHHVIWWLINIEANGRLQMSSYMPVTSPKKTQNIIKWSIDIIISFDESGYRSNWNNYNYQRCHQRRLEILLNDTVTSSCHLMKALTYKLMAQLASFKINKPFLLKLFFDVNGLLSELITQQKR